MFTQVSHKVIVSGKVIELFSTVHNKDKMGGDYSYHRQYVNNTDIRLDNLRRSKSALVRLIRCNPDCNRFITLTFADKVTSLSLAYSYFRSFISKMVFQYSELPFKYIAVAEFQRSGRVHYHILCNIPYLENSLLERIWSHGFTFIERTYGDPEGVAHYLANYLTSDVDKKMFSRRRYYYSQTCFQPRVFRFSDHLLLLLFLKDLRLVSKCLMDIGYGVTLHYYRYEVPDGQYLNVPKFFKRTINDNDRSLTVKGVRVKLKDQEAIKPLHQFPFPALQN